MSASQHRFIIPPTNRSSLTKRRTSPKVSRSRTSAAQAGFFQSDFQTTVPCYRSPTRISSSRWRQSVRQTAEAVEPIRDLPAVLESSPSVTLNEWQPASVHRFTVPNGTTAGSTNDTGGRGALRHGITNEAEEVEDVEDKFEDEITSGIGNDDWSELWAQQTRKAEIYSIEDELEWDQTETPVRSTYRRLEPSFADEDIELLDDIQPSGEETSLALSRATGTNAGTARDVSTYLASSTANSGAIRTFRDTCLSPTESLHYEFRMPKVGRPDRPSECLVSLSNVLVCPPPRVSTQSSSNANIVHSRHSLTPPESSDINRNSLAASRSFVTSTPFPSQQPISWTLPTIDTSPPRLLGHPPPRPKKYRVKPGGYLERLHQLVRQERSSHILWHHVTHSKFSQPFTTTTISPQVSTTSLTTTTAGNCLHVRLSCVMQRGALLEAVCNWVDPTLTTNALPELHALKKYYCEEMEHDPYPSIEGQHHSHELQRQADHYPLRVLFIRDYLSSFEQSRAYDSLQQTVTQGQVVCLYKPWFAIPLAPVMRGSEAALVTETLSGDNQRNSRYPSGKVYLVVSKFIIDSL
ncbi:hypothetical protein IWQ61_006427 [Dispira simplex]|nr:hypothetical protein IWQ61_006427 [Dispira simplex]